MWEVKTRRSVCPQSHEPSALPRVSGSKPCSSPVGSRQVYLTPGGGALALAAEGHRLRNDTSFVVFSFSAKEARISG